MRICSIEGCDKPFYARTLCKMHYERQRHSGEVGPAEPTWRPAPVDHRGSWFGCWEWEGPITEFGHGVLIRDGKHLAIHREVYEAIFGVIPEGLDVCHHCDNPPCYRPEHLFVGTRADNIADMVSKTRQARGERHSQARLTEEQVRAIRRRHPAEGTNRLAAAFGVRPPTITSIIKGQTWAWLE